LNGMAASPPEGLAGSLVLAYVWDIPYESDLTITWDGDPLETSTFLSEFIGLPGPGPAYSFIVPDATAGDHTVRAFDEGELWAETTFTVIDTGTPRPPRTGCFIATAAYGTPMAEEVQILRDFRDEYLLTNALGQVFVDFYYGTSPRIAEFITDHPGLKPIVRAGLVPVVTMSALAVSTTATQKAVTLCAIIMASVAVAVWMTKRRGRDLEQD